MFGYVVRWAKQLVLRLVVEEIVADIHAATGKVVEAPAPFLLSYEPPKQAVKKANQPKK